MQPIKSDQTWLMREHADGLCCVLCTSGYWRLCTDGKENSTDPAVVRDRAGWNWTPQWDPGHNPPAEHTHQQERQNEGNTHALHTWLLCVLCIKYVHLLCIWMKWLCPCSGGSAGGSGSGQQAAWEHQRARRERPRPQHEPGWAGEPGDSAEVRTNTRRYDCRIPTKHQTVL